MYLEHTFECTVYKTPGKTGTCQAEAQSIAFG